MELNLLSQFMFELMVIITAFLHLVLPSSVEPMVSSFMIGNLFAIYVFPFSVLYLIFRFSGFEWFLPYAAGLYLVVLQLDSSHLTPPDTKRYSHFRQRNWVQDQSLAFWTSHFSYFPITVKFGAGAKEAIDPNAQYLFAVHPHGIHCWPLNVFAFVTSAFFDAYPGMPIVGAAATIMFKLPVIRELFMTMHYRDAGRKTCEKVLGPNKKTGQQGSSLFICTGGEAESLQTSQGVDSVVLEGRTGFVRLALSWGTPLVPVYGLGVTDLYTTYTFGAGARRWLAKNFGIALPLFTGRFGTPLPHQKPVTVLIGKPIEVPKPETLGAKPSDALVDEYHKKYIAALTALYDAHAPLAADGKTKKMLQIARP